MRRTLKQEIIGVSVATVSLLLVYGIGLWDGVKLGEAAIDIADGAGEE